MADGLLDLIIAWMYVALLNAIAYLTHTAPFFCILLFALGGVYHYKSHKSDHLVRWEKNVFKVECRIGWHFKSKSFNGHFCFSFCLLNKKRVPRLRSLVPIKATDML